MGYTVDEANKELKKIISGERPATKDELRDIIKNLDVADNYAKKDATTLLYSGLEYAKIELLEKDRNVRMLNHTEAYKFLNEIQNNETFKDAWEKVTGDGVKKRTSWIKAEDAFLVYDKNEDGKIAGINEIFGSRTIEGFSELRDTIDSNYDNKIDRRDVLFNRLQIWHDKNQDGQAQEGELTYLKDAGIDSIDLNSVNTNIQTNISFSFLSPQRKERKEALWTVKELPSWKYLKNIELFTKNTKLTKSFKQLHFFNLKSSIFFNSLKSKRKLIGIAFDNSINRVEKRRRVA